jgi:ABC-type branched-subunit amino acid transport system ATPase component
MAILMVDWDIAFVASLATRALVMQKGTVIREVSPQDLVDSDVLGGFSSGSSCA